MNQRPRERCLMKKTGVQKSRETVPLILCDSPFQIASKITHLQYQCFIWCLEWYQNEKYWMKCSFILQTVGLYCSVNCIAGVQTGECAGWTFFLYLSKWISIFKMGSSIRQHSLHFLKWGNFEDHVTCHSFPQQWHFVLYIEALSSVQSIGIREYELIPEAHA